jgi:hypothetical protein
MKQILNSGCISGFTEVYGRAGIDLVTIRREGLRWLCHKRQTDYH